MRTEETVRTAVWTAVVGIALGCSTSAPTRSVGPAPQQAKEPGRLAPLMAEHFEQVLAIRDGVIAGDLRQTRAPAAWLAEHGGPSDAPVSWKPYRVELRRIATGLSDGSTVSDAATRTAQMAAICGLCHRAAGVRMERAMPALVEQTNAGTKRLMMRHRWAVDRLWDGLVGPSDTAWEIGAGVLADAPLETSDVAHDGRIDPRRADLVDELHRLGDLAPTAKQPGERAALVGKLLATCSGCHSL